MAADAPQDGLEQALDRIEGTILPCIGLVLETLLDTAEAGKSAPAPEVYAAELHRLALQLEALTREVEALSPQARRRAAA